MMSILKTLGMIFAAALLIVLCSGLHAAIAASTTVYTVPTGSTSLETIACNSGTSPCTISNTSAAVLNANAARMQCLIQNINTVDLYCNQGTGTASSTSMHFVLKAASAANKGDGGTYSCTQGPAIWRGAITCIASGAEASPNVNASAASAAGF